MITVAARRCLERQDYVGVVFEMAFGAPDGGYWPDERVEGTKNNIREALDAIELDKQKRAAGKKLAEAV